MSSEQKPHIVYAQEGAKVTYLYPNYADAFAFWKTVHTYKTPYLLATVECKILRQCTPAAEIVDTAE